MNRGCLGIYPSKFLAERTLGQLAVRRRPGDYWQDIGWWGTSEQLVDVVPHPDGWAVVSVDKARAIEEANAAA